MAHRPCRIRVRLRCMPPTIEVSGCLRLGRKRRALRPPTARRVDEHPPVRPAVPSAPRSVRAYAQRTTGATEVPVMQRVPASLEVVLGFEFGSLFTVDYRDGSSEPAHRIALVGSHCSPNATLSLGAGVESFAIFLQPTALQRLLGIPTHQWPTVPIRQWTCWARRLTSSGRPSPKPPVSSSVSAE